MAQVDPKRGEIWNVNFDRTRGDEINNMHPALVINIREAGRLELRLVVPITTANPRLLETLLDGGHPSKFDERLRSRLVCRYFSAQIRVIRSIR